MHACMHVYRYTRKVKGYLLANPQTMVHSLRPDIPQGLGLEALEL